jgi:hypothetical protein
MAPWPTPRRHGCMCANKQTHQRVRCCPEADWPTQLIQLLLCGWCRRQRCHLAHAHHHRVEGCCQLAGQECAGLWQRCCRPRTESWGSGVCTGSGGLWRGAGRLLLAVPLACCRFGRLERRGLWRRRLRLGQLRSSVAHESAHVSQALATRVQHMVSAYVWWLDSLWKGGQGDTAYAQSPAA